MRPAGRLPAEVRAWHAARLVTPRRCGARFADADRAIFATVLAHRSPAVIAAARAVSGLAEPAVVYPVLAAAGLVAARGQRWQRAVLPCLVVASGAVVRRQLSEVIARPRPPASQWLAEPAGFSLPSRHTTIAALTAGASARALAWARCRGGLRRCSPLPGSERAASAWACTGQATSWRAGSSPRHGWSWLTMCLVRPAPATWPAPPEHADVAGHRGDCPVPLRQLPVPPLAARYHRRTGVLDAVGER